MTSTFLAWAPRILGLLVCAFLGLFALDAFSGGRGLSALPDFFIHLIPSLLLLAIVFAAWRHPWIGALAFTGLGIAYIFIAGNRPHWILVISGPLFFVGSLFFWTWWSEAKRHA